MRTILTSIGVAGLLFAGIGQAGATPLPLTDSPNIPAAGQVVGPGGTLSADTGSAVDIPVALPGSSSGSVGFLAMLICGTGSYHCPAFDYHPDN